MIGMRHIGMLSFALALLLGTCPLVAQEARDPTVAPGEAGTAVQSPTGVEGMTVLVRGDKTYLVVGTRLYAPGDKVGNLRVERITETEVWFHDGSALTKVPRFAGIERKVIVTKPVCAAATAMPFAVPASAPENTKYKKRIKGKTGEDTQANQAAPTQNPLPAVTPCEDTQP